MFILGHTALTTPIPAFFFSHFEKKERKRILVLAGVHGNEIEGVWLAEQWITECLECFPWTGVEVLICPRINPDGIQKFNRLNSNGVDLNRNLPSLDWNPEILNPKYPPGPFPASEKETEVLLKTLKLFPPAAILSLHSFEHEQINVNGPALDWAQALHSVCAYPITEEIGYQTPGSLGSYAGKERHIPTITLEIKRGMDQTSVLKLHQPLLAATLNHFEKEIPTK